METITPEVLIISHKHDYGTDHVAYELLSKGVSYLRLNRDQFSRCEIELFPTSRLIFGRTPQLSFKICPEHLKTIYFRAPTFLRDSYQPNLSADAQMERTQWSAFLRGLAIFEEARWVNHPQATYKAEIKPYQLYLAKKIGLQVPDSIVTNTTQCKSPLMSYHQDLVIKTVDAMILNIEGREGFIYTNIGVFA